MPRNVNIGITMVIFLVTDGICTGYSTAKMFKLEGEEWKRLKFMNKFLCSTKETERCCDCDDSCVTYGSCCVDIPGNNTNHLLITSLKLIYNGHTNALLVFSSASNSGHRSKPLVTSCPAGAGFVDSKYCQDENTSSFQAGLPVVGDATRTYKNSFCARCNGVKTYEFMNTTVTCKCLTNFTYNEAECFHNANKCISAVNETNNNFVERHKHRYPLIRKCKSLYKISDLFQDYKTNIGKYANRYCPLCGHCSPRVDNTSCSINITFSTSMRIQVHCKWPAEITPYAVCNNTDVYDILVGRCVRFTCLEHYQVDGFKCTRIDKKLQADEHFDNCLAYNSTTFFALDEKRLMNSSRLLKRIFATMGIRDILSDHFSTYYEEKEKIIVKIKGYSMYSLLADFPNINQLLGESETLIWHSSDNPVVHVLNNSDITYFFSNNPCTTPTQLDFTFVHFTNTCDILFNGNSINYENVSMWMSVTKKQTRRYITTCLSSRSEISWPFTIFMAGLLCFLFYYFFRTICYKNQGYIRTYYVKTPTLFPKSTNLHEKK